MQIAKLRAPGDENGLVPAGQYFMRLAEALREANIRAGNVERPSLAVSPAGREGSPGRRRPMAESPAPTATR